MGVRRCIAHDRGRIGRISPKITKRGAGARNLTLLSQAIRIAHILRISFAHRSPIAKQIV